MLQTYKHVKDLQQYYGLTAKLHTYNNVTDLQQFQTYS